MPYYFGEDDPAWEAMCDADGEPKPENFNYIAPPDFGFSGPLHPIPIPAPPAAATSPTARAADIVPPTQPVASAVAAPQKQSWLDRLLGRSGPQPAAPVPQTPQPSAVTPPPASLSADEALKSFFEANKRHQANDLRTLSILVPILRDAGIASVYGRYDGGNDEGFAWFDHAITSDGQTLSTPDDVAKHMAKSGNLDWRTNEGHGADGSNVGQIVTDLAATILLGHGFGTGPFYMYGAFKIDCIANHIADDPKADRVPPDWDRMDHL